MRGCRWCSHEYWLSGDHLRLREGVYCNAVECLNALLRRYDTATVRTEAQPHSRIDALIPAPRINAELSEELPVERAPVGRTPPVRSGAVMGGKCLSKMPRIRTKTGYCLTFQLN